MDEENIKTPEEQAAGVPEQSIENELEELRDTFQTVLDETAAEAEKEPVIQELDYHAEEPAAEAPADSEESAESADKKSKKKDKAGKGKKKIPVAAIVIPVVLCVLIIIPLLCYFLLSIKVPDFNQFISAYTGALASKTAEERVINYEAALEHCGEDTILADFRQDILESIVAAKCETEGYSAARSYMTANMTEEMIAAPKTKEFRQFLALEDSVKDIANTLYAEVIRTVGDKKDDADIDYAALVSSLGVSELIADEIKTAAAYIGAGAAGENAAETKEAVQAAIGNYLNAYSTLSDMNADCSEYLEKIVIKLYNYGYAYEAQLIINQYIRGGEDEEEYKSENEEFNAAVADLETIGGFDGDVFALAVNQASMNKAGEEDFIALFTDAGLSEKAAKALAQIAVTAADAQKAEQEHNLTKAATYYSSFLGAANIFGFPCKEAAVGSIGVLVQMGDTQSANSLKATFFGEDEAPDEDSAAILSELDKLYDAQNAANEVFYPFYYNSAYYGAEMDKSEINKALDALVTDSSNEYDKAFVEYYKYLAEAFTDADNDVMLSLLEGFADTMKAYPLVYGYSLAQLYQSIGENEKAVAVAEKMLEINIADDLANSLKAFSLRAKKDTDGALKAAREGMELSGAVEYCAYEAAVDLLLNKEYAQALDLAKQLYSASLTTDTCELIMVIAAKYDGDDAALKDELKALREEIEQTYGSYGIEASDDAKGLIDGTLTLEDVFLDGNYDFG